MEYSIREAAEAAGVSKSTIQRLAKKGELSKNPNNKIDASELARLYPDSVKASGDYSQTVPLGQSEHSHTDANEHTKISVLQVKLEAAEQTVSDRDKELAHRDRTIEDLRTRLDKSEEKRDEAQTQLTALLTDQRRTAPETPQKAPLAHRGYLTALILVLVILGALWLSQDVWLQTLS